ncbi:MAG TPA: hypothetical protein VGM90_18185 [Kofleriaceae bacterium]|jgi:hypothetical protein
MRTLVAVVVLAGSGVAEANVRFGGAHGAYSIGGAVVNGPGDGARSALDVGFNIGFFDVTGNRDGMWDTKNGYTVGASLVTGFSTSPTFAVLELGSATDTGIAGGILSVGPVVRVDQDPTAGLGLRVAADVLGVEAGVRVIAVGTDTELSIAFTIGIGRL